MGWAGGGKGRDCFHDEDANLIVKRDIMCVDCRRDIARGRKIAFDREKDE